MIDDNITARRQSAMVLIGIALVALAIGCGSWYGFKIASAASALQRQASAARMSGATEPMTPASGRLPNSSGIDKNETIISKSYYARPPAVFDVIAAIALTASAPVAAASGPAPAGALVAASSAEGITPSAGVMPAGWAAAGAGLDRIWESNAAAAWNVRSTPLTPPNWRISGVVQRGEQTQIMIQFDGDPATRFFKVGDVLPGGGKLAWVKPNVIGVSFLKQKPLSVPLVEDPFQPASSAGSQTAPAKAKP